ncbi:MAG: sugar phosphate nucleotidyltransferase [Candidatus Eisenbacteria bacterium]|nr:sugar phosphate nucleotidyltransferase [Candidatus Eisenbacteria bacterium]
MKAKAVIPVAGVGTRLRPHTHTVPKALINVAGKPIVAHILDELVGLGITEVVLIIGHMGQRIREFVDSHYKIQVSYVEQRERRGLGHAIFLAQKHIGDAPVLIVLGDTIFQADFSGIVDGQSSLIGVKAVPDPSRYGVVETSNGVVQRLVEKPDKPRSNLAIVGIYYLVNSKLLFECLGELIRSKVRTKGEYQLTDALELMIEKGEKIGVFPIEKWMDCGETETLLEANRELLNMNSKPCKIDSGIIIPPVAIDPSAKIENSIVGPHVSVAAFVSLKNSIVRNSIINERASVQDMLLDASVVGERSIVEGAFKKLNVGDSSEIQLT